MWVAAGLSNLFAQCCWSWLIFYSNLGLFPFLLLLLCFVIIGGGGKNILKNCTIKKNKSVVYFLMASNSIFLIGKFQNVIIFNIGYKIQQFNTFFPTFHKKKKNDWRLETFRFIFYFLNSECPRNQVGWKRARRYLWNTQQPGSMRKVCCWRLRICKQTSKCMRACRWVTVYIKLCPFQRYYTANASYAHLT